MRNPVVFLFFISSFYLFISACQNEKQNEWKPAESPLLTRWATDVSPDNAWPEYPRPQMQRKEWINLNGLWNYSIVPMDSTPVNYREKILVPFPVESALSGVGKKPGPEQKIWFEREILIPDKWSGKDILLHFEASDWETTVWIDNAEIGSHKGGYNPFSFNISEYVNPGKSQKLVVSVWDPTDEGYQPRGKQLNAPHGIFYTPSSGIWQTVWLEPVPHSFISALYFEPDIDNGKIWIKTRIENNKENNTVQYDIFQNEKIVQSGRFDAMEKAEVSLVDPKHWSPDDPFLYDIVIRLFNDEKKLDEVISYFGMRKISLKKDDKGFNRLALNNEILFQNGPLDQGFWPDGLNTPPSDEAMRYDIEVTKAMGFNMLRKHVKVENRRFYYWCDKLGMCVWQDMPNAQGFVSWNDPDLKPSKEHRDQFEYELEQLVSKHFNHPSIVMWVPFNEGWGQYDTHGIVDMIKGWDQSRLVNNASGWTDRGVGDVIDIHSYPEPRCPDPEDKRASVLGEFGGLGFYIEGHTWQKENWGYEKMQAMEDLISRYESYYQMIFEMRDDKGLAAVVYTQTTDVETETNGLITYDRDQVKMGIENIRSAHRGIIPPTVNTVFRKFIDHIQIELNSPDPEAIIKYTFEEGHSESSMQIYDQAVIMDTTFTLKTMCVWPDGSSSRIKTYHFDQVEAVLPVDRKTQPGLHVSFYHGNWDKLPEFESEKPVRSGITKKIDLSYTNEKELFGLVFEGYLDVPATGVYMFYLSSDDGARMYLDEQELIDYDGIHGAGIRKSSAALQKGLHPFRLIYFQRTGGLGLKLFWEGPGIEYQEIGPGNWKN